ncbi:MAG TPA: HD-GYP domain-containing protein [Gaiellaceae bacterium]|nr:HD-GYP domain-containing protein [Gaiellaceae bacterium]
MSTAATVVSDELVRDSRTRYEADRLERRARLAFSATAAAVTCGALVCAAVLPTGGPQSLWKAALFAAVYAVASRADFELGIGSAVPTAIVFVPMLFALPLGIVPATVAVALVVGSLVGDPRAFRDPARVLPLVGSAGFTFGPVLVLHFAHAMPVRWSHWPVYVAALGAQFAFDFVAGLIGNIGARVAAAAVVRLFAFVWLVDAALAPLGLVLATSLRNRAYLIALALPLLALFRIFAGERRRRLDHALELSDAYRGTAFLLGDVIDADDAYTGTHSRHVVRLTVGVCDRLRLSPKQRRDAEFAALLHDVGKIRIPHEILNKTGPLTDDERAVMESHAAEGERLLTQVGGLLGEIGHVVRSCHERWDGTGYPDRLAGEEIPRVSRIISACDAYSAMTTDRPYRLALPAEEARAELARCAGTQFDPSVVAALIDVLSAGG